MSENQTDLGNTRRLVAQHGEDLRYVPAWRTWLAWDGTRWAKDTTGEVFRRAKQTARDIMLEAVDAEDPKTREALAAHSLRSEGQRALRAMVELAETEPGVPVEPTDLDAPPWMLNCPNGTLDLRSQTLLPHERRHLLTKVTGVAYDPNATCPVFAAFLERILPDPEVRRFVQRALGYSLTGAPTEEVLFFAFGPPASGKSTLLEGVKAALGEYATTADFETFLQRRDTGPRPDIARLAGTRYVASVEVDDGKRLASGLVKTLTGGDTVTARFLYGREFEFRPAFTLWLAANDEPRVRDDDAALWRRILQVPFAESIPEAERDPAVKAHVTDPKGSGPALLAWMVEGIAEYLEVGLRAPEAVRLATNNYRERMDPLAEWMDEELVFHPSARATAAQLYESYAKWCAASGIKAISRVALGKRLSAKGFTPDNDEKRTRRGIGIRHPLGQGG